jgi:hypothetical protein
MTGERFSPAYFRELLHNAYYKHRARHPSLFPGRRRFASERSAFLGEHLFDDSDGWLDPQARERLKSASADNYAAWKLLFHWKVWQWVHAGTLNPMLDAYTSRGSSQVQPE